MKISQKDFISLAEAAEQIGHDISAILDLAIEGKIKIHAFADLYNTTDLAGKQQTISSYIRLTQSQLNTIRQSGEVHFYPNYEFEIEGAEGILNTISLGDLRMWRDDIDRIRGVEQIAEHQSVAANEDSRILAQILGQRGGKAKAENINAPYLKAVEVAFREWKRRDRKQHNRMADWLIKEYNVNNKFPFSDLNRSHLLKHLVKILTEKEMFDKIKGYNPKK